MVSLFARQRTALHRLTAGHRLLIAALPGVAAGLLGWRAGWGIAALLVGWCAFAVPALVLTLAWLGPPGRGEDARTLARDDQSSTAILALVLLGCGASVTAIGALLLGGYALPDGQRWTQGVLALATIVLAWLLIHVRFAFHYAHRDKEARDAFGGAPALTFPATETPDYGDYLYFSFVIGTTSQVSDVAVQRGSMRRLVMWHSLLAFAYNLLILALAINALAAMTQGG